MNGSGPGIIALVGTGNVAWHLGHAFTAKGIPVSQVLGRSEVKAKELAEELNADRWGEIGRMEVQADICLICISDDSIRPVIEKIANDTCLFLHTAGSLPLSLFNGKASHYGVFYPLQTLTKGIAVDFARIPLLIEANTSENVSRAAMLAGLISNRVVQADTDQRMILHLAAVFTNNFTNHMVVLSERILAQQGLSIDLLGPLLEETFRKARTMPPAEAQTGPAVRGNKEVMRKHLELLAGKPELAELYRKISESIGKVKNDE